VIDYRVWYDQANGNYIVLQANIVATSLTVTTLTMGTSYKFKVESRNSFGFSLLFSNEITVLQAEVPSKPNTPTTTVNTDISVLVDWNAPSA